MHHFLLPPRERDPSNLQELSDFLINSSSGHGGPPTHLRHANTYAINRFGRYYSYCRGLFVLGPGSCTYCLAFPSFAFLLFAMIVQRELITAKFGSAVMISGFTILAVCFLSFVIASISDPGVVPKDYSYYQLMEETAARRLVFPGERYYRYCNKCGSLRPPRSYHCNVCNICVRRHEFHAHIIGTCVGERNFRSFFCFHISLAALSIHLFIYQSRILFDLIAVWAENGLVSVPLMRFTLTAISLLYGLITCIYPNVGVILLLYRIYLICVNRTCREEHRIFSDKSIDNPPYVKKLSKNVTEFLWPTFFYRSAFRRNSNAVDDLGLPLFVSNHWRNDFASLLTDNELAGRPPLPFSPMYLNRGPAKHIDESSLRENKIIKGLAAHARQKSWSSLPQIVDGGLPIVPGTRIKTSKLGRPLEMLQKKIESFHKSRTLSKAEIAYRKQHQEPMTLSDGCIPRTENTETELVTMARAAQIRAIIERVISRDRRGLIDLSRRINIAALVGIDNFDPDDLQVIELSNGIPLVTRRNHNPLHHHGRRIGGAQHTSPQMVAAGFLPPAQHFVLESQGVVRRPIIPGVHHNQHQNDLFSMGIHNTISRNRGASRRRQLFGLNPTNNNNDNAPENFFGPALVRHNPDVLRTEALRRNAVRNWNVQRFARDFIRNNQGNVSNRLDPSALVDPLAMSDENIFLGVQIEEDGRGSGVMGTAPILTDLNSNENTVLDESQPQRTHFQQIAQNLLRASQRLRESLIQSQILLELAEDQEQHENNHPDEE